MFVCDTELTLNSSDSLERTICVLLHLFPKKSQILRHWIYCTNIRLPEKPTFSCYKRRDSSVSAQRPPLSPKAVAAAVIFLPVHVPDPLVNYHLPYPLPPPCTTKTEARKSKLFKHVKSVDSTFSS